MIIFFSFFGPKLYVTFCKIFFSIGIKFIQPMPIVKSKFRGIDPWILHEIRPLTAIDAGFCKEYESLSERITSGWAVKLVSFFSSHIQ